jgi:uncharacterized Fe-S cluster-containing radical SAM superfamily protein
MELKLPFDPILRSAEIEDLVMHEDTRLYYRFRASQYYGGIATADAVGCSFLCAYCWNLDRNLHPDRYRTFYSPRDVGSKLLNVADSRSLSLFRVSGSEPILGQASFEHILRIIRTLVRFRPDSRFVLETNGLFLGAHPELIVLLRSPNLRVRVSLKGIDEKSFTKITGAHRDYFFYSLAALCELDKQGIYAWPALMEDLFSEKEIAEFRNLLTANGIRRELELESLQAYPHVLRNLEERKLRIKAKSS